MPKILTKSGFMKFLQCRKYLWLYKYRPELATPVTEEQENRFAQGFEVESYAEALFKGGVKVESDDIFEADRKTRALMGAIATPNTGAQTKPAAPPHNATLFQPTLIAGRLMARADIITFNKQAKAWDIYEVKATNEVKKEHIPDVAFQKKVFAEAGFPVNRTFLVHLNKEYVRSGPIDAKKLIKIEDITAKVQAASPQLKTDIPLALAALDESKEPQVRILKQCSNPYDCPFIDYCWKKIPDYSVYDLTGVTAKKLTLLLDRNIMLIKDIPAGAEGINLTKKQKFQVEADKTGKTTIFKKELAAFLKNLKYPLYFLDYETWDPAVPPWNKISPYRKIPFQYSLHVARTPADLERPEHGPNAMEHHEFLPATKENPIPALIRQLKQDIDSPGGTVLVWNRQFETGRNSDMAKMYPAHKAFLKSVNDRVLDLMQPFAERLYVHPGFKGSHSIKNVLPVLGGGVSYDDIEIGEGSDVGRQWSLSVFTPMPAAEARQTRANLLAYCSRDTYAMVRVLKSVVGEVGD